MSRLADKLVLSIVSFRSCSLHGDTSPASTAHLGHRSMRRSCAILIVSLSLFVALQVEPAILARAEDQPAARPVSFTEDLIPVLTKAGCNQGACHGGQFGQGGFKLSLLGFAPEQDHPAIVRDWDQRRISLLSPKESLILRKAVASIPHGGGKRMAGKSPEYET